MRPLPHHYAASASSDAEGSVCLASGELPVLRSAPPKQFDGPGDQWSPEELFLAAVGDCFVLTFRAIARASSLSWKHLDASVEGLLERVERTTRFTQITVHAELTLNDSVSDGDKAHRMLEKAERTCLVANSLAVPVELEARVVS